MMNKFLIQLCIATSLLAAIRMKADVSISNNYCSIKANQNGAVTINDKSGSPLITINGIDLKWEPVHTDGGTISKLGDKSIKVDYKIINDKTGKIHITGIFECDKNRVNASYTINSPDAKLRTGGTMYKRKLRNVNKKSTLLKEGIWSRHEHGGIPYEKHDVTMRCYEGKENNLYEVINGICNWSTAWAQHISFKSNGKGTFTAKHSFLVLPKNISGETAAAIYKQRQISLAIVSAQDFNLWESRTQPDLKVRITNSSNKPFNNVSYKMFVRNYDGKLIRNVTETLSLTAGNQIIKNISLKPLTEDEFYFIEAAVTLNGKEIFARTMASVMHNYEYKHGNDIFGIAAYFNIPSKTAVDRLLKRMGVRRVRKGDSRKTMKEFGAIANWHSNVKPKQWRNDPAKRQAWLESELKRCEKQQNPYWEFCNEWNMRALNKGTGADVYVNDWLKPLTTLKKQGNYKVKLLSMGIAGGDTAFLKAIHDNGGWDLLDGIAFHPGRGNVTADYAGKMNWCYLGSIHKVKKLVEQLGKKPLWITEAYACTFPNGSWYDSYRNAAENIILTYALGLAEGIECVMFYQLQNSTWFNKGGIHSKDNEYYYGILRRDGTVKPSLPAYCAIAEALDGAKFVRWLTFKNSQNKGLLFSRPEGQIAILWNRKDGYFQTKKSKNFASAEPWISNWQSSTDYAAPAQKKQLTVVDCIGRKKKITVKHGKAILKLTGSPIIVYGTNY